jgi:hypothetical protein
MHVPARRLCDLCRNEIDTSRPFPTMTYPLDQADLQLLAPPAPASRSDVFPGIAFVVWPGTANTYSFEFCRDCIDGILPMLKDLKTDYIRRWMEDRQRRQRESA